MILDRDVIKLVGMDERAISLLREPEIVMKIKFHVRLARKGPLGVDSYVVYHNSARGPPCKGGLRMAEDVTIEETIELAEIMTYKSALMDLPFGGGKSAIRADSDLLPAEKAVLAREFAHKIRNELTSGSYVPAPDLGTGPREMAAIFGETHMRECVTGKPVGIGGLPGRLQATGRGVASITERATKEILNTDITNTSIAVQGFGNVGSWTCEFLSEKGAKIVAVTDKFGGTREKKGLDVEKLREYLSEKGTVDGFNGRHLSNEELFKLDVDVLIPAAIGGVISADNAGDIKAKMIAEGANAPTTRDGDEILHKRNIAVVPDILANAGGVVASYDEWRFGITGAKDTKEKTFATVEKILSDAWKEVLDCSSENEIPLRKAAYTVAATRLVETMEDRGWV